MSQKSSHFNQCQQCRASSARTFETYFSWRQATSQGSKLASYSLKVPWASWLPISHCTHISKSSNHQAAFSYYFYSFILGWLDMTLPWQELKHAVLDKPWRCLLADKISARRMRSHRQRWCLRCKMDGDVEKMIWFPKPKRKWEIID